MKKFCYSLLLCSGLVFNTYSVTPLLGATVGRVLTAAAVLNGALAQAFFAVTTVEYLRAHGEVEEQRKITHYLQSITNLNEPETAQSKALMHYIKDRQDQYGSNDTDNKGIGSHVLWGTVAKGAKNAWIGATDIADTVAEAWKEKRNHLIKSEKDTLKKDHGVLGNLIEQAQKGHKLLKEEKTTEEAENMANHPFLEAILKEAEEGKTVSD